MAQLGHTDPKLTLRVYTHMMRRGPGERERLRALVAGEGRSTRREILAALGGEMADHWRVAVRTLAAGLWSLGDLE